MTNCLQVSEAPATFCAVCDLGFSLTVDGQCVPYKAGCLECKDGVAGPDTCHRCKRGVVPNTTDPGACVHREPARPGQLDRTVRDRLWRVRRHFKRVYADRAGGRRLPRALMDGGARNDHAQAGRERPCADGTRVD